MRFRHKVILLIGTVGCAVALVSLSAQAPELNSLGTIESAAPPYFTAVRTTETDVENERAIIALREEAHWALAQLKRTEGADIPQR